MVKTEEIPILFMSVGEENKPCIQAAGSSDSPSRAMSTDSQGSTTRPAPSFGPLSVLQTLLSAPFVAPTHKSDSEEKVSTIQPSNDVALRSLLDLPRLDEKAETAAEAEYRNLSLQNNFSVPGQPLTMPQHDPSDCASVTQSKLHLAYVFYQICKVNHAASANN